MYTVQAAPPTTEAEAVPVWERREQEKKRQEELNDLPFGLYLLFSSFTAIAAVRNPSLVVDLN
jgi:hypothetical protein